MSMPGPFTVTFFDHYTARFKREVELSLSELADMIRHQTAETKSTLPWIKLAIFGNAVTNKGSLRHNPNVKAVTGVEVDYDGEEISFDGAVERLEKAGVEAIAYTSASHLPDKPRYRILCRFSQRLEPNRRAQMVARLNGLFHGALASESFTLSQAFYYGHTVDADNNPVAHRHNGAGIEVIPTESRVEVIDGQTIDQCDELDRGAIGKSGKARDGDNFTSPSADYVAVNELVRRILTGESLHPSVRSIAGKWARNGWPIEGCIELIGIAFTLANQPRYGDRWKGEVEAIRWVYEQAKKKKQPEPKQSPITSHTLAELKDRKFMQLKLIVPRYIPEGVTLLAGKPKLGKSWLMLSTAIAVATGGRVLDEQCEKRDVLYCALEDTPRRMKSRTETIMRGTSDWPDNVHVHYELPTIDRGGIERLQELIDAHKTLGLIIIDTLARFRGQRQKNEEQYQCDYRTMSALLDLSRRTGVAIIVVHHVRKQTAEDIFDTISGTMGLTGSADTLAILTRAENDLRLCVRGRDCEPEDKIVDFDSDYGVWTVTGDYEGKDADIAADSGRLILSVLSTAKYSMKADDIAKQTGLAPSTTRSALRRLDKKGQIQRTAYGTYCPPLRRA